MKELGEMEDEVILPADKGNATVVMKREEYNAKMKELLETATYRHIQKDPTATHETRLNRMLRKLGRDGEITQRIYNELRPTGSQPPKIYGLPKIHKPDVPL